MLSKKIITLIIYGVLSLTVAYASNPWLKKTLRYANPDSVLVWGYDGHDCRSMALKTYADAAVYPIYLTQKEWKERKDIYRSWLSSEKYMGLDGAPLSQTVFSPMLSVAKHITQAAQLFRMQGDARYADYIERSLFNAVMHSLNDSVQPKGSIDRQVAANLLFTLPGFIYATSADGDVYVNLYTNSTASLAAGETRFSLDQITDMPLNGRVKLRFNNLKQGTHLRLHLRLPEWLKMRPHAKYRYVSPDLLTPSLFVNGHEVEPLEVDEKGYVVIDREWQALDEVFLDMPLQAQYVVENSEDKKAYMPLTLHNEVALQFGPLFYQVKAKGYSTRTDWDITMANEMSSSGFPKLRLPLCKSNDKEEENSSRSTLYEVMPFADGETTIPNEATK